MIYKLFDIKSKYLELIDLSKLIINFSNQKELDKELQFYLSQYFLNNTIKRANSFYVIEEDNKIIGALIAYIPNLNNTLEEKKYYLNNYRFASYSNLKIFNHLEEKMNNKNNLDLIKHELNIESIYTKKIWVKTLAKNDSAEILFFAINSDFQGKGYSKKLLNFFFEECKINNIFKFNLFTTSNCDHTYYINLKMNLVEKHIISNNNLSLFVFQKNI